MQIGFQEIVVIALVVLALLYISRVATVRMRGRKDGKACGSDCGCGENKPKPRR